MFEVHHHASMLADKVRNDAYAAALQSSIRRDDSVLDVGAGTGLLAAMATRHTVGTVYAYEFLERTADFARQALLTSKIESVRMIRDNFLTAPALGEPNVLVTETIGALGPEEGIVELTCHALSTYPRLRALIPSRLSIFAVPIKSDVCKRIRSSILTTYDAASRYSSLDFGRVRDQLDRDLGCAIYTADLGQIETVGPPTLVVEYWLGRTPSSEFSNAPVPCPEDADALHLYFVADLAPKIELSTFAGNPPTHWKHSFVLRPKSGSKLSISYNHNTRSFKIAWNDRSR